MPLTEKEFAATEVLARADRWEGHRVATNRAAPHEKARAAGRYEQSGRELAQAVIKYRKAAEKER